MAFENKCHRDLLFVTNVLLFYLTVAVNPAGGSCRWVTVSKVLVMSNVIIPPKSPDVPAMLSTEVVPGMGSVSLPGQLSMSGCSEGIKHMQEIETIFLKQRRLRCHKAREPISLYRCSPGSLPPVAFLSSTGMSLETGRRGGLAR